MMRKNFDGLNGNTTSQIGLIFLTILIGFVSLVAHNQAKLTVTPVNLIKHQQSDIGKIY